MALTTRIGHRDIPFEGGDLVTAHFSAGGGGLREAGAWEFWTVVFSGNSFTARWRPGKDPGERFRSMESSPHEIERSQFSTLASAAEKIRPATMIETVSWLHGHIQTGDTQHLRSLAIQPVDMEALARVVASKSTN